VQAHLKVIFQYTVILGLTIILIWFSLRGLHVADGENKWEYLYHTWQKAHKGWLLAMALVAVVSHVLRAQRWKMLLEPTGYKPTLLGNFLSVMVGYLVNLVIPRGGEVSRCYNLYKLEKIPAEISFGTVVVERLVDLVFLVLLILIAFIVEFDKLMSFINTLPIQSSGFATKALSLTAAGFVALGLGWLFFILARRNQKLHAFLLKLIQGFKDGFVAIFKLEHKLGFIAYSVAIWFLYFVMSYCVILAFPETSTLGMSAVLSLFAIGSIAMAVPLPGGTGSYHTMVPAGLVFLYNIPKSDAVAFTFVFHGWQTLLVIVVGAISLVITSLMLRKKTISAVNHS
jgi:hypothetical protein